MPTPLPPDTFVTIAPEFLATPRLRLRPWTAADRAPFAAMNADPAVMAHFSAPLARDASDAMADRIEALIAQRGWGFWAADCLQGDSGPRFMGFVGLHTPSAELPIGWRLARPFWGQGLASEAARLALRAGFEDLGLAEIVSFTTLGNQRSRAVMQRLGMRESPAEAFDHPAVPVGHPVRPHCLYRLARTDWHAGTHGG
ncbi:GNAT family N-acetyltransferase [Acidovorax sp. SUPP2825]|uniref:GNAT family N-acetyltransferase n=1 Tax=Acidovorax sp. SUPP2825 TaxID=2920879 RepID=UPI0023DE3344|nr:GNAT family N-acetyltransferase [Acidovorax sp. SUPP2825]GKS95909.1 GNAT family N-acetyltransferase [Acidovorax sp. SUPP2825]